MIQRFQKRVQIQKMKRMCLETEYGTISETSNSSTSSGPPAQLTLPEDLINLVASFAKNIPDPKEFAYPINEDVSVIIEPEFFYDSKGNLMGFLYVSTIEGGHRTFTWLLSMTAHAARHEYEFMCEYEGVEPNTAEFEEYFEQLKSIF